MTIETDKKTLGAREFIEQYLIDRIISIADKDPYFGFTLIGIGIESLGAFLDRQDFHKPKMSSPRFKAALQSLFDDQQYFTHWKRIYESMRCGLAHVTKPKENILLFGLGNHVDHLTVQNKILILSLDRFRSDYIAAAKKLITMIDNSDPHIDRRKLGKILTESYSVAEEPATGRLTSDSGTGSPYAQSLYRP